MTNGQIKKCRERLERFLVDLLEPVVSKNSIRFSFCGLLGL
jgi:hypothetical protein